MSIKQAIEERKARAKSLGIVDAVFKLYREHFRFLKDQFDYERDSLPTSLTKVSSAGGSSGGPQMVTLTINDIMNSFDWNERDRYVPGGDNKFGTLDFRRGNEVLLQLKCTGDYKEYIGIEWSVYDVGAFLEGPWVEEINKLWRQVSNIQAKKAAEARKTRENDELQDLKKKFGL
jgi:hypothetical protein